MSGAGDEQRPYEPKYELDEDDMRRKRLARLQAAAPAAAPTPMDTSADPPPSKPAKKRAPAPEPMDVTPPAAAAPAAAAARPAAASPAAAGKSFERWQHDVIRRVLRVAVAPLSATPPEGVVYLAGAAGELADGQYLTPEALDAVLVERLALRVAPWASAIEYLQSCFVRAGEERRKLVAGKQPERDAVVGKLEEVVVNYAGLCLLNPEMFGADAPAPVAGGGKTAGALSLVPLLMRDDFSPSFLDAIAVRYKDDGLQLVVIPVAQALMRTAAETGVTGNFFPLLRALGALAAIKPIGAILLRQPNWVPELQGANGRTMQNKSFLGPFFHISAIDDAQVAATYFANIQQQSYAQVKESLNSLHMYTQSVVRGLHQVMMSLLRASKDTRHAQLLDWIAEVLKRNGDRAKMHMNAFVVSQEGFMMNLSAVMLELCQPFLDAHSAKARTIDNDYIVYTKRLDLSKETSLAATTEEVVKWADRRNLSRQQMFAERYKHLLEQSGGGAGSSSEAAATEQQVRREGEPNFITECFFLTLRCQHLGLLSCVREYMTINRQMQEMRNQIRDLEASRATWAAGPGAATNEISLGFLKKRQEVLIQKRFSFESQLLEPQTLALAARFELLVANWLMRVGNPDNGPLPLKAPVPMTFASLPEHVVENVVDLFLFLLRVDSKVLNTIGPLDDLLSFMVTFLRSSVYIKNPYLRSKFVEVMVALAPTQHNPESPFGSLYASNKIAHEHLIGALMTTYVDIEFTGSHNQFFEKFSIRHSIALLVEFLWQNPVYRASFGREVHDKELFLRFVNMLVNDQIFLLDESIERLVEIHEHEVAFKNQVAWMAQPEEVRTQRLEQFAQAERSVRSFLLLAGTVVDMLAYLTEEAVDPFLGPELVDRMASMLNYFLKSLAGPKCQDLKVQDPEKHGFKPKELLKGIATVYIRFSADERFLHAVVRDGRSCSPEVLVRAAGILRKFGLVAEADVRQLESFVEKVKQTTLDEEDEEEILGDIPDDFLDPVMATLMTDPVKLPTSGHIMDRVHITRHLLSDNSDPFNRQFLSADKLIPQDDLRKRIEEWVAERKAAAKK